MDVDGMASAMTMPLLPQWLLVAWASAFAGVALTHVSHTWFLRGQARWWHLGHTLMALGMLLMYVRVSFPRTAYLAWDWAGAATFGSLALASLTTAEVMRRKEGTLNPLWVVSTVDQVVMLYMLLPGTLRFAASTYLFVVYLAGQSLAWALGVWGRIPAVRPTTVAASSKASSVPTHEHPFERGLARPARPPNRKLGLPAHSTPAVRISLAAMAAGMAYMLIAM